MELFTYSLCISQFQAWPSPRATPGVSHIPVAPGVGFSPPSLSRGFARGVLNQSKSSIILKKKRDFRFVSWTTE